MNINPIMTYNRQNQVSHKAHIEFGHPLGLTKKMDPRSIACLNTEFLEYISRDEALKHCVECTKVIFENSQHFLVNAKKEDVEKAIKKAIELPNGQSVKVGEPLLSLCNALHFIAYKQQYDQFTTVTLQEYMENCPNNVSILARRAVGQFDELKVMDDAQYRLHLRDKLLSEGTPSGEYRTRFIDQMDWSKEDTANNTGEQ